MVPPCRIMDSDQRWPAMQHVWSGWLVNIPIHIEGDSRDGAQIGVTSRKWPEKHSESTDKGLVERQRMEN